MLLSIRDYMRLVASEPKVLRVIGEESHSEGTDIRSADPNWSSAALAQAIMRRFAVSLHRRTVERARQR